LACLLANQRPASDWKNEEENGDLKQESAINDDEEKSENVIISVNNMQEENVHDLSCKDSSIQKTLLSNATRESTSQYIGDENTAVQTEETDGPAEIQLVDLGMECDVAANVLISVCGEISMGGDSNSFSGLRALENCGGKSSDFTGVHNSETSFGIDVENSNSNTHEIPLAGKGTEKCFDKSTDNILGSSVNQDSPHSDIVNNIDNFDTDSDDGGDDDDDDWERFMKLRKCKGRRKRCKIRRKKKERYRKAVVNKGAVCKYKNKRTRIMQAKKEKRSFTDSVEETIEQVISKFCYGNGKVECRKGKYRKVGL
jgi:hypothetical protein